MMIDVRNMDERMGRVSKLNLFLTRFDNVKLVINNPQIGPPQLVVTIVPVDIMDDDGWVVKELAMAKRESTLPLWWPVIIADTVVDGVTRLEHWFERCFTDDVDVWGDYTKTLSDILDKFLPSDSFFSHEAQESELLNKYTRLPDLKSECNAVDLTNEQVLERVYSLVEEGRDLPPTTWPGSAEDTMPPPFKAQKPGAIPGYTLHESIREVVLRDKDGNAVGTQSVGVTMHVGKEIQLSPEEIVEQVREAVWDEIRDTSNTYEDAKAKQGGFGKFLKDSLARSGKEIDWDKVLGFNRNPNEPKPHELPRDVTIVVVAGLYVRNLDHDHPVYTHYSFEEPLVFRRGREVTEFRMRENTGVSGIGQVTIDWTLLTMCINRQHLIFSNPEQVRLEGLVVHGEKDSGSFGPGRLVTDVV